MGYAFEKLEVYHLAVTFREIVKKILATIPHAYEHDIDQLNRSSKSTVRNICEGSAEFRPREKARFYRMALRSAQESGGSLRMLESDTKPNPLHAEAHRINYILIAKLTVMCKNRS